MTATLDLLGDTGTPGPFADGLLSRQTLRSLANAIGRSQYGLTSAEVEQEVVHATDGLVLRTGTAGQKAIHAAPQTLKRWGLVVYAPSQAGGWRWQWIGGLPEERA